MNWRRAIQILTTIQKLTSELVEDCPERQMIIATLEESKFHYYHHKLGAGHSAIDVDFLEWRSGRLAAILEAKRNGRSLSRFQADILDSLAVRLNLPLFEISFNEQFDKFRVTQRKPVLRVIDLDEETFKTFMDGFRLPEKQILADHTKLVPESELEKSVSS